jgi:DNA-binding transcriptional LysR family regulator
LIGPAAGSLALAASSVGYLRRVGVELSDLRCFTAVSEALHFGQAAAKLGYTPSNVSYRIRRLEHELGTTLFRRTSRRVALTVQGERLLRSAQAVLQAVDELHRRAAEIQGNVQRTLAISYTPYTNDIAADLIREWVCCTIR